jgi:hypothetical protein
VNKLNKKSDYVRNILLACFLFGLLFCLYGNHSAAKHKTESEKQQEYVTTYHSPVISEKYELKIFKSLPFSFPKAIVNAPCKSEWLTLPRENFSEIKILLKLSIYNLYFASGLHEPLLAA